MENLKLIALKTLQKEVKEIMDNDPSHDFSHIQRVYKNAKKLAKEEKANSKILLAATLLHDIVKFPKSDPRSITSSIKSANKAKNILKKYSFSQNEIRIIADAIQDHSFSRKKTPKTLEGKILQDADRLDAIGAIGIARAFAVSGSERRPFYRKSDPFCSKRRPDDQRWTVDHFYKKLLHLEKSMHTKSAKIEAKRRTKILKKYLSDLKKEI